MVFGQPITPLIMLVGGLTVYSLITFQVLVGLRKIKLGRQHFVYHKYVAFTILGVAAIHGMAGILFLTGFSLF